MQDSDLMNIKLLNSLIEAIYKKTQEKPVVKIIGERVFIKINYKGMVRELELSLHRLDIGHVFNDIRWLKLKHENDTLNEMAKEIRMTEKKETFKIDQNILNMIYGFLIFLVFVWALKY